MEAGRRLRRHRPIDTGPTSILVDPVSRSEAEAISSDGGWSPSSATPADRHRADQYSGRPCELRRSPSDLLLGEDGTGVFAGTVRSTNRVDQSSDRPLSR